MKLRAIRLHNVKRFAGMGIAIDNIGNGVNVLTAANEVGKSTCFEALHALFFQPHSSVKCAVQLLRPYAGGNPLVEADIETDKGAFRLTKQFYGGRNARVTDLSNGRLVAQADEAERFIADLTRGGVGGPAGLLWIRQGMTGIEKRSKPEEEEDRRIRETLLSSVQGEVEALTGGRRMAEIVAACDEALSRLVTATLRPKAGGPFAEAIEERDRLQALERQLASDVATLRDALDRRRAAERRLAEIDAPAQVAARNEAIAVAEEAVQAARSQGETLRAAEADLALAGEQHRTALAALEQFDAALARAARLQPLSATAAHQLEQAHARHLEAQTESDRLHAATQIAETAERQARDDKARLDAAQAARDAAERFDAARERLTQAEAIRTRIETAEALMATLQVPDKTLDQLDELDRELARLRAMQSLALPSLRMTYADPAELSIVLGDTPLAHDRDRPFTGTVDIDIAHIGRLTIRSQHIDDAAQAIHAAEAKARTLLAGIGVDSPAAARQRQNAAREKSNELVLARQLLMQAAPDGIESLRRDVTRLDALRGDSLEIKFDATAILDALAVAEARVVSNRHAAREAQPILASAHQSLLEAHAAQAELLAELRALESTLGLAEERAARHRQMAGNLDACRQRVLAAQATVEPLRARAQDIATAEITLRRLRGVAQAATQEVAQSKEILAELNGQIRIQADKAIEENWQETKDLLSAASDRAGRYEIEVRTLDRLRKALAAARSSARDLYLKPVMTELRPLIGLLFDDITVAFNEDTLLPETVLRNG